MALFFIPFIAGAFGGLVANKFTNNYSKARVEASIVNSHVVALCTIKPEFAFYKERGWVKSLLDYLGVFEEFKVGDARFDREVYISSDSPLVGRVLKESEEARRLIQKLLSAKEVSKIEFHKGVIDICVKGSKTQLKENLENVMRRYDEDIEMLASIFKKEMKIQSQIITSSNIRVQEDVNYNNKIKWILVAYVSALTGVGTELMWEMIMRSDENIVIGSYSWRAIAMLSTALFILTGFIALYLASPSRKTHRVFYTHFTVGLITCALAGPMLYNSTNVMLDTSPATSYSVDYTTYSRRGSKSTSYYMVVVQVKNSDGVASKYHEIEPGQSYRISGSRYRSLGRQGNVKLDVKSGFFKQPYIVEI